MKRFLVCLICCLLLTGVVQAETVLTSLDDFYGVWVVCSSNGDYEYLTLHDNGTFEAYDAWQKSRVETHGDALLCRGAFTFDPATGTFTLEGDELVYTLRTGSAEGLLSDDFSVEGTADMRTLLLSATVPQEDDVFDEPSKLFLPLSEGMMLLPSYETLTEYDFEWIQSDTADDYALDAISYRFAKDGTGEFLIPSDKPEADVVELTYTLDNGLMTAALADGTTRHWLMQFAYRLLVDEDGEPLEADIGRFFDTEDDTYLADNAVWSDQVLLVRDLDDGSSFYLIGSEG